MQSAETVLGVLRDRGRRGLSCNELYRQLFNPQLYLMAYGRLYSNKGAMTPGANGETADGMSIGKIDKIIDAVRHERYRFSPAKRVYIPKKNGRKRPLGMPSWSDKLVGEVVRLLLDAFYEPTFSDSSHGFRPGRGCHTALREVMTGWSGTTWFIEGDITKCFERIDHEILLETLGERIHDNRFLRLVRHMLQAGYLEDWKWNATRSGTPQGGIVSPILSNIYLDRLDSFARSTLIPEYTRGERRRHHLPYHRVGLATARARKKGDRDRVRELRKQQRTLPSSDPQDPGFRRLRYCRYADDILLGFTGPKSEAEEIKQRLAEFLRDDLKLELSEEKTLITHARTGAAKFLSYEIVAMHNDRKISNNARNVNGKIMLRVPTATIKAASAPYLRRGNPEHRPHLLGEDDFTIVKTYGDEYRGIVQYYLLAGDVYRLYRLHWVMVTSLLKTLAAKHDSTVTTMARKYSNTVATPAGPRKCIKVHVHRDGGRKISVAQFGGIPLRRQKKAILWDRKWLPGTVRYTELVHRLLAGRCEACDHTGDVVVHQVRKLTDLGKPGPPQPTWVELMVRQRRKTLVVCEACHATIHAGNHLRTTDKSLESRVR